MRNRSFSIYLFFLMLVVTGIPSAQAEKIEFSVMADDGVITSDSLRGHLVYIDFWASWCVPCRKSFPWMNAMQAKYEKKNFKVLAINVDKNRHLADEFLQEFPADFQIAYDPTGELAERLNVVGMPMAFLMDKSGQLIYQHVGFKASKVEQYEKSIVNSLESTQ